MDLNNVLTVVGKMFPSANLSAAVEKAQQAINGTTDSLDGVSTAARNLGLNPQIISGIYEKYGKTAQARTVCSLLGTTPEALKADAERIVGGGGSPQIQRAQEKQSQSTRFPRLK